MSMRRHHQAGGERNGDKHGAGLGAGPSKETKDPRAVHRSGVLRTGLEVNVQTTKFMKKIFSRSAAYKERARLFLARKQTTFAKKARSRPRAAVLWLP